MTSEQEPSADKRWVGERMLRVEDGPLLKGRGGFVDDLPVKKGTLHAAILRSPHPHARILSIDVSEALKQPGVKSIMTGAELAEHAENFVIGFETPPMDYRGMAIDKVRYVGEPVVVLSATDRYKAEDALDFIRVDYEPLPAVIDPVAAEQPGAPILHDAAGTNVMLHRKFSHGEPAAAFAEAVHETEFTIRYPRNSITPMETYAVVAEYLPDARSFDVISNFQGPFSLHPVMARSLGVQGAKLRHRSPPNSGGSFGSKLTLFPYIVVMCVAAKLAGRPVKWIEDRLEHLSAANSAPNRVTRVRAAYDGDGVVSALELEHWDDNGAYLRAPMPAPIFRMHGVSTNGYTIPNVHVTNHIMVTNKCPSGAVRGFGGPQLYFAVERMMQRIATELGLDPLDVIRRNLIPAGSFPYRAPAGALIDSGDYQEVVDKTVAEGGLDELKRRREAARAEGRIYGIGYTTVVEPSQSNMGYISTLKTGLERERAGQKDGAIASCVVNVDPLGAVSVTADSVPQGQGHQTALAQVVADRLGIDPADIAVNLETDTQKDGWSIAAGNYSCRFAPAVASSVHIAASNIRDKVARIASQTLNVPPDDLEFERGRVFARDNPENSVAFYRAAGVAHWSPLSLPDGMMPGLREAVDWSAPELTPTTANDEINTSLAYGFGFDFCGIEIDRATGEVRIDKYVTSHDCGTILNPGLAEGQIRGSFAAAFGATMMEEFVYAEDGSFLSGTFADYLAPTAPEMPELTVLHPVQTPSPYTRLGAKGIAEGNQYSTPACLANAVADALGIEDVETPLAPSRVYEWLHGAERPPPEGSAAVTTPPKGRALEGSGAIEVPAPREEVWRILMDPARLAAVIPGCETLEQEAENAYRAVVDIGVGPVRGRFEARVSLSDLAPPASGTLSGSMIGPLGSSHGTGRLRLEPTDDGTRVAYDYEIHLAGKVAAVGGRMLQGASRVLIGQFFAGLIRQCVGDTEDVARAAPVGWWSRLLRTLGIIR